MPAILAFLGLLVIAILEKHNVKGGVLISIAGISFPARPRPST